VTPQRADARDNRARILAAADQVFGEGGSAASTEDVARLAGVGIATVFRHFPTKYDLLAAVMADRLGQLADLAGELLAAPDAGAAFRRFFTDAVEGAATKITIADALADAATAADQVPEAVAQAGDRMRQAFAALLARAQAAGAVRPDVADPEVFALMVGTSRAAARTRLPAPTRTRMLSIIFTGLTPTPDPTRTRSEGGGVSW
jgi:AcrR family transcriptional regulator